MGSWKQRYFVLNTFRELRYFDNERTCLGVIDVSSIQQDSCHGKEYKDHIYTFQMKSPDRTWILSCKNQGERSEWTTMINILRRIDWESRLEQHKSGSSGLSKHKSKV